MKILVAGDFRPSGIIAESFENYEFEPILGEVKLMTQGADYSIVNLESPVVEHVSDPIEKCGPNLKCKVSGIKAIQWAGFDCVTLANNHFRDYGDVGVRDTIDNCRSLGIDVVGGGLSLEEASRVLYKEIYGQRLAIINCCEHEFSIATSKTAGSNPLNPIQRYYDIQEASRKADRVLVVVHGGIEHFQLPTPRMVELYRFFIDAGADAVVNHHQHCFSGYEVYKGKPIFYGLGNFCYFSSEDREGDWTEGFSVIIDFSNPMPTFELFPYIQNASNIGVVMQPKKIFENKICQLNDIIVNRDVLKECVEQYYRENMSGIGDIFEPIHNKYYLYAVRKSWLPSLITKRRIRRVKSVVFCETHCDKLKWWLNYNLTYR